MIIEIKIKKFYYKIKMRKKQNTSLVSVHK